MADATPPIIDYSSQPSRALAWGIHLWTTALSLVVWLAVVAPICFIVPRFTIIFRDFKTQIPALTKTLLEVSSWFSAYGWAIFLLLCLTIPAIGLWIDFHAPTDKSIKRYAGVTTLIAIMLYLVLGALMVIAMFMPMVALIDTVAGPTK